MKNLLKITISILVIVLFSMILLVACTPAQDVTVVEDEESNSVYLEQEPVEITPISVSSTMGSFVFGKFPQSLRGDVRINTIPTEDGYYLGDDGNKYYKNGTLYYMLEDVVWDAYELESGDILLISQKILTATRYDDYHDYFEFERRVFDEELFNFTDAEYSKIQTVGVEYSSGYLKTSKRKTRFFFIDIDTITNFYPSSNKIVKQPTTYAASKMKAQADLNATWWLAPSAGRGYFVTKEGSISNKSNTYLDDTGSITKIAYAYRGIAPAIIISANS